MSDPGTASGDALDATVSTEPLEENTYSEVADAEQVLESAKLKVEKQRKHLTDAEAHVKVCEEALAAVKENQS